MRGDNGLARLSVTISEENQNSLHAFRRYCAHRGMAIMPSGYVDLHIPEEHFREEETLFDIAL